MKNKTANPARARARYLTQAIRLEEQHPSGIITGSVLLSVALLLTAIVWASVTEINETAKAPGEVVPAGLSVSVQHPEGGLVKELKVREGDRVVAGDVMLQLDDTALRSEMSQIEIREAGLELQAERLAALLAQREPVFARFAEHFGQLVEKQQTIYQAQRNSQQRELEVIDSQIRQREQEVVRQRNQVASVREEVALVEEQVKLRRELTGKRIVARTELLNTQSRLAEVKGDLRRAQDGVAVALTALEESKQRRLEQEAAFYRDIELEAGKVAAELAEVSQTLVRLRDRVDRVSVKAPVAGIVQNLAVTAGQVVLEPGQVILQLIPIDDDLVVNARVSPADIGHIREGDRADISVDSYDTARFGLLEGKVRRLSASTYLDEKRQPYYKAEIVLTRTFLGSPEAPLRIIPGMTVKADIRTGKKTVMNYLLRPVQRGLSGAFGER